MRDCGTPLTCQQVVVVDDVAVVVVVVVVVVVLIRTRETESLSDRRPYWNYQ